ncbi:Estradiol 17-beta-dehydrogenase [Entamoeba marina]
MVKNVAALTQGIIGGIVCIVTIIPGLIFLWKVFIKPYLFPSNPKKYQTKQTYAVITGASGGIGKGFAERFAKEGYNLIIMARRIEELNSIKEELEKKYNVIVKAQAIDFLAIHKENGWNKIRDLLDGLDIGVLVNNVGMVQFLPGKYDDLEVKDINSMISLNINTTLEMSRMCIPLMTSRTQKGLIINLSSSTALIPYPMIQVYASTKSFIKQFSDSLHAEYRNKIDVICFTPWAIKTDMTKIRETAIYVLEPSEFVDCCFKYFGQQNHIDPYWFHYLMDIGCYSFPEKKFSNEAMAQQSFVRERFLLRLKRKAEAQNTEKPKEI